MLQSKNRLGHTSPYVIRKGLGARHYIVVTEEQLVLNLGGAGHLTVLNVHTLGAQLLLLDWAGETVVLRRAHTLLVGPLLEILRLRYRSLGRLLAIYL